MIADQWLAPLLERLASRQSGPFVYGIRGAQGRGKSTVASILQSEPRTRGVSAATLSIDDLHLSRDQRARLAGVAADPRLLIVVGMAREARIVAGRGRVLVGTAGLAEALAARPAGVISFGVCGALDPALGVGDVLVADGVAGGGNRLAADPAWADALRAALPTARGGDMAANAVIIDSPAAKAALRLATGAAGVDMESEAVAAAATRAGIPFAILRAVSDTAARALPRAAQAGFRADGQVDVWAVIRALLAQPGDLPDLIRVALEAEKAFRALERAAQALAPPPA